MGKNFEHFIRFFKPDSEDREKNFYEPREPMIGELVAKIGETWRFLVPKSDIGLSDLDMIRVDL